MDYITFHEIHDTYDIPKRTLLNAAKRGYLKTEERKYPQYHLVTTQEWLTEWINSNKKRTRKTKTTSR